MINGFRHAAKSNNHHSIAVSNKVKQMWENDFPNLSASVVHNGIQLNHWNQSTLEKDDYVIWFGRIAPKKGTHLAIQAALKANRKIVLCGPIYDQEYYNEFVKPLIDSHLDAVEYKGNLDVKNLAPLVAKAKVFVCTPCWEEPFGLVVAEALATGTPIAGFNKGALPEIVTSKVGVLVESNVDALADAIFRAEKLDSRDCVLRANEFSLSKMVDSYINIYNQIILSQHQEYYAA